jgi:hypothetical protein
MRSLRSYLLSDLCSGSHSAFGFNTKHQDCRQKKKKTLKCQGW